MLSHCERHKNLDILNCKMEKWIMLKLEDLVVDKEFEELLPVLTPEEFDRLEQSVLKMV